MVNSHPSKEKAMFHHALLQAFLSFIFALFLVSPYAWDLIARASMSILNIVGVQTTYVEAQFLIYLRLMDGTVVGFQILTECSGLITIVIFTFISAFTIGLLRGRLSIKLFWFALSIFLGFIWNLARLASVIAVAYHFGLASFSFVHYILAPTIDFVWVVSLWALGMSWLKKEEQA